MQERYIVTYVHDSYERLREHTEDGFDTYDAALQYAKEHARCVDNGRVVCFDATIYTVTAVTTVYQRRSDEFYVVEKEA